MTDVELEAIGTPLLCSHTTPKKTAQSCEEDVESSETQQVLTLALPKEEEASCGFWILKGAFFDRFANHKIYTLLYGVTGCYQAATSAYFNGTITSMEKEFGISTRNAGIISIGNNISQIIVVTFLSYYADRGHRPRWIAIGLLTIVAFCLLSAATHFLFTNDYGHMLTNHDGLAQTNVTSTEKEFQHSKLLLCGVNGRDGDGDAVRDEHRQHCQMAEANLMPQAILFVAQFISGIGIALYYTLGIAYMDDNTSRSETPAHLSISFFLNLLGPSLGYALVSFCLQFSVGTQQLTATIDRAQTHWIGAWWLGWLPLAILGMLFSILFSMLPRRLPLQMSRIDKGIRNPTANAYILGADASEISPSTEPTSTRTTPLIVAQAHMPPNVQKATYTDLLQTLKRLCTNKILMSNNISSVFYFFGYTPFWIFTPKYLEIQFRQTAASSSLATGSVAFIFTAVGILLSGIVLTKYKPSARYMAGWNVMVGLLSVVGIVAYAFIACVANERAVQTTLGFTAQQSGRSSGSIQLAHSQFTFEGNKHTTANNNGSSGSSRSTCNANCDCGDDMSYAPVCGADGNTYISPCQAGCKSQHINSNGKQTFYDCACIRGADVVGDGNNNNHNTTTNAAISSYYESRKQETATNSTETTAGPQQQEAGMNFAPRVMPLLAGVGSGGSGATYGSYASLGACTADCMTQFYAYLLVMCLLKFLGAAGRTSNLIISMRCVSEEDKTTSLGFGMMMISVLTFIPSPIFFGWLFDRHCVLWGGGAVGCAQTIGNCWLYDVAALRIALNWTAAAFVSIGTLFDIGVWYYSKDLQIFDDNKEQSSTGNNT